MSDPPNHVTATSPNTLGPFARRLPLGIPQDAPRGRTFWRIWIPTVSPGTLRITHDDGQARLVLSRSNLMTGGLAEGNGEITYQKPSGEHGELVVILTGLAGGKITCTFRQKRWSRAAVAFEAPALLPWNFYYWPAGGPHHDRHDAQVVMRKYADAIGKSGEEAARWEGANHQVPGQPLWAGHCHNSAPASAVFEQPSEAVIGGVSFSQEEMELLASEYFGSFGSLQKVWELTGPSVGNFRFYLPAYLKPGGAKTEAVLASALSAELAPVGAANAATIVAQNGGEAAFARSMNAQMGKLAATFFQSIEQWLGDQGYPLLANMRSYTGGDNPVPVWNQIYFCYEANYVETAGPQDDLDMSVQCDLYSNKDSYPSVGAPADVIAGEVVPATRTSLCQIYKNKWRFPFKPDGSIDSSDARCAWESLANASDAQLFAPTQLQWLGSASRSRYRDPEETLFLGNPAVGRELLAHLTLRERFR